MGKWWLVAKHEFLSNVRRRSFLFAAFGAPLFTIGIMVLVFGVIINSFESDITEQIGYVDLSGVLTDAIERPEMFTPYPDETAAAAALESGDLLAYFVVAQDYMATGGVTLYRGGDVPPSVENAIENYLLANLGAQVGNEDVAQLVQDPVDASIRALDSGRTVTAEGIIGLFIAPFIFMVVFLVAVQTTSGYLMSSVVDEKSNRVMEILVTSVTPFQLLFGKVIGLGLLGLLQLAIWLVAGAVVLSLNRDVGVLSGVSFPPDLIALSLVYFLLNYFLTASIMAGIGAAVGSEQESRQIAGIFGFITAIPFFFIFTFFEDPNGPLPTFLTLFPLTSPMVYILRSAFTAIPTWQVIASLALLALTTVAVTWAAARIFRWTLLMYGKKVGFKTIMQALRSRQMGTTATGEAAG
ncbi:MAG: ABC transporter permease [Chloroflexota bacterium]|nr:ABC transporter permease [Chloroflexota bacterium]